MKTTKNILALLRAIRAASPYASRNWQWEAGHNSHLADPFAYDEQLGGYTDTVAWKYLGGLGAKVGSVVDFYVYQNEGDVRHPDWSLHTNYVVTITSPTTATIRDTGCPVVQFSL